MQLISGAEATSRLVESEPPQQSREAGCETRSEDNMGKTGLPSGRNSGLGFALREREKEDSKAKGHLTTEDLTIP